MFSALKFVAAGVIVALFGGFLLTGILTTQQGDETSPAAVIASPSPTTAEELLSGMVTEEVEPGVFHVINDGRRDLWPAWWVYIGQDGSIWGSREDRFFQLGGRGYKRTANGVGNPLWVTRDGTLLSIGGKAIRSFDGKSWQRYGTKADGTIQMMSIGPDDTIWATWEDPTDKDRTIVARQTDDGWERLTPFPGHPYRLYVLDTGDIWVKDDDGMVYLGQYVDGTWRRHDVLDFGLNPEEAPLYDIGEEVFLPDGSVTVSATGYAPPMYFHYDGTEWREWQPSDGAPTPRMVGYYDGGFEVADDGSAWFGDQTDEDCKGVARFDGVTASRWLEDLCVDGVSIAPDGAVWVLAGTGGKDEDNWFDLYVITPEAVAGK